MLKGLNIITWVKLLCVLFLFVKFGDQTNVLQDKRPNTLKSFSVIIILKHPTCFKGISFNHHGFNDIKNYVWWKCGNIRIFVTTTNWFDLLNITWFIPLSMNYYTKWCFKTILYNNNKKYYDLFPCFLFCLLMTNTWIGRKKLMINVSEKLFN